MASLYLVLSAAILILLCHVPITCCEQIILLDTTTESSLNWTRYQVNTLGWIEETYTNFDEKIIWRSYVVCDVTYANVSNWLWTPYISRGSANRIYIEVRFTIRDCSMFPGSTLSCKETFSLMYYEFGASTRESPPWKTESYKLIDRIVAGEERDDDTRYVAVKSIAVSKHGVYFAFRDQEVTANLAYFPQTPTGKEFSSIVEVEGTCIEHAEIGPERPTYLCKSDGKWQLSDGGCRCKPGYEPDFKKQQCLPCAAGKFKSNVSNNNCTTCPQHSKAPDIGMSECRCNANYYRASKDPKNMPCTQPTSAPQNLTVDFIDQTTLSLTWFPPQYLGDRYDTLYHINCDMCTKSVNFSPAQDSLNTTKVTISNLTPTTTYKFEIIAENGVSYLAPKHLQNSIFIRVTTDAIVPSIVSNVHVTLVKSQEITVAWDAPQHDSPVEIYEVRIYPRMGLEIGNATSHLTKEFSLTINGLQQKTEYGLQVRAKTAYGWGAYSPALYQTTGQVLGNAYMGELEGFRLRLVAGGIVAIVVILATVIVITVLFLRSRASDDCNKKQPSDCDTLEYRNGEGLMVTYMTTPLFTSVGNGSTRSYIDPHTYEDPNQAVREFAREIDASTITIEAIIGGGEFGDVCKGKLRIGLGIQDITVAIKTLKVGSTEKAKCDFLTEASIMGQFEHPNVIFLQGVVTKSNPVMIITEFMENGSLDTFMRNNEGKFQVVELVAMLRGIASGMHYLSEMNYVHRDLAARNVLVNAQLVCKIADFGLSREIESTTEGAYTTRGGKIPVRWTAPEAIAFRKFTSASDVWSMGIVCWEVMSYGERPYWNWSNQDVIKSIEKGYRLPPPIDCPEIIYQLMLDCWQTDRLLRPNFFTIVKTLEKLMRVPDMLRKLITLSNRHQQLMPQTFNCSPYLWHPSAAQSNVNTTPSSMDATLPIHDIPLSDFSLAQPQHQTNTSNVQTSSATPSTTTNPNAAWILHAPDYCTAPPPQLVNDWPLVTSNAYYPLPSTTNSLYQQAVTSTLINNQKKARKKPSSNNAIYTLDRTWTTQAQYDYAQSVQPLRTNQWSQTMSTPVPASASVPSISELSSTSSTSSGSVSASSSTSSTPHHQTSWLNHLVNNVPDLLQLTSIEDWLKSIKMHEHLSNFHSFGLRSMDQILKINIKDLNSMGITSANHQKRILNSLQAIQAQLQTLNDGFLV